MCLCCFKTCSLKCYIITPLIAIISGIMERYIFCLLAPVSNIYPSWIRNKRFAKMKILSILMSVVKCIMIFSVSHGIHRQLINIVAEYRSLDSLFLSQLASLGMGSSNVITSNSKLISIWTKRSAKVDVHNWEMKGHSIVDISSMPLYHWFEIKHQSTVKPFCSDHLYNKLYILWFIK